MGLSELPIGVYDSGVGGISVLSEAMGQLPNEHFIYYGDSANAPYGSKTENEIKELSLRCGEFLYRRGVKMIVIACNTATSIVVQTMRERYSIPIISVEPAVKPAMECVSEDGRILVLATPATLRQQRYIRLLEKLEAGERVINVACDSLAALIEDGDPDDPRITAYLQEKLNPFRGYQIDGIVIGCTHYSFISERIRDTALELCHGRCEIFDGRFGTARHIRNVLKEEDLLSRFEKGGVEFFTSGDPRQIAIYEFFSHLL